MEEQLAGADLFCHSFCALIKHGDATGSTCRSLSRYASSLSCFCMKFFRFTTSTVVLEANVAFALGGCRMLQLKVVKKGFLATWSWIVTELHLPVFWPTRRQTIKENLTGKKWKNTKWSGLALLFYHPTKSLQPEETSPIREDRCFVWQQFRPKLHAHVTSSPKLFLLMSQNKK